MYQEFKILSIRDLLVFCTPDMYLLRCIRAVSSFWNEAEEAGDYPLACEMDEQYDRLRISLWMYRNPEHADKLAHHVSRHY